MNLGRVSLTECIQKLKEGKDVRREAGFIVGNFYVEVDVVRVEPRRVTAKGNVFVRAEIEESDFRAVLIVWGSKNNTRNIEVLEKRPSKIRIIRPVKPSEWAVRDYNVSLWAHEDITRIAEV